MTDMLKGRLQFDGRRLLFAIAVLALSQPTARAQAIAPSVSATASSAQSKPLAFDVVSIKLNKSGNLSGMLSVRAEGDGLSVTNVPMQRIISFAYDFRRQDIVYGAPNWATTERYDIIAKVAGSDVAVYHSLNDTQRRVMLQAMLADCCSMRSHLEMKEVPIYALVVAKGGPKMREAMPGDPLPVVQGPQGQPIHEEALYRFPGLLRGQQIPMKSLALALSDLHLGREVVDKTGLTGNYDFKLEFDPDQLSASGQQGQTEAVSQPTPTAPSIFTAVDEQLGLKLESTKGPVQVLIIDHIERPPEN